MGRPTGTRHHRLLRRRHRHESNEIPASTASGGKPSISYDTLGNAVRTSNRTGANAFEHTYRTYDRQGQVVHEVNALNHVTRYTYTSFGERETVTRYSVTISGTPANGMYWTAAEVDPQLNWGHDENGNLMPDVYARTITLAYDKLGRKIVVTQPTASALSTPRTRRATRARPIPSGRTQPPSSAAQDAAVTRYEYNAFGDLTLQRVRTNNIVEWQDTSFTYDAMGRRTRSVDAAGNVTAHVLRRRRQPGAPGGTHRTIRMAPTASPNSPTTSSTSRPASIATA